MENLSPPDINFFTTYQCNSRCRNCQIWRGKLQHPSQVLMDTTVLERLLNDPIFKQSPGVGLAGGEPTIAPFTWQFLKILPTNKRVTITTNALASTKLVEYLSSVDNRDRFTVQLSLDGIGAINDKVRGIEGAYQKTLHLLQELEKLGVRRLISFTINRLNADQLLACYDLAEKHDALFSTRLAYSGGAYSNQEQQEIYNLDQNDLTTIDSQLETMLAREIKKPLHSPAQLVFWRRMTDYARGIQRDLPCLALHSGMVIDLYGNVFPNCPVMMEPIGNLHQADLSEIWQSEAAEKLRKKIDLLSCGGCWNDCQVVTNIDRAKDFLDQEYTLLKLDSISHEEGQSPKKVDFNNDNSTSILSGWFGLDGTNDFRFRWTGPKFSLLAPCTTTTVHFFAMFPETGAGSGQQSLEISVGNSTNAANIAGYGDWQEYCFTLPKPAMPGEIVRFKLAVNFCPAAGGHSQDFRQLGMAVHTIEFS